MTYVWTEIVCATCARTATGQYTSSGRVAVKELKANARREGFLFKGRDGYCSEECLKAAEGQ